MSDALERENAELLQFLYACPVGLVALDGRGNITMLNPLAMQLMLPLARDHAITNFFSVLEPYAPELRAMTAACVQKNGTICAGHRLFVGKTGGLRIDKVLDCTLVKLDANRFVATIADVSVVAAQERRLRQAEVWFSSLVNGVEDFAAISLDAAGRIDHVNSSARRQTGFEEHELVGRTLDLLDSPDPASGAITSREQVAIAARDGWHLDEGWCARKDGSRRWYQRLISVCREDGDLEGRTITGFAVVLRAVTKQKVDAGTLRRRLTTDHLTGAANRAHLFEVAEQLVATCRRDGTSAGLVVLDIDHFKKVNDTFGHAVGDDVLKTVSAICRAALRPQDTFARLGGEEFVALLPLCGPREIHDTAEKLRAAIARSPIATEKGCIDMTASFGCAVIDCHVADAATVIAEADAALYRAKKEGRNRVASASQTVAA